MLNYEAALRRAQRQAFRILGNYASAEDVAAEAVIRIIAGADPRFFGLIVNGLAIDEYRRRGKEIPVDPFDTGYLEPGERDQLPHVTTPTFEDVEFRVDFDAAVRALDNEERDAFILTHLRGLTVRESAGVLDAPKTTVHRRVETARTLISLEVAL